MASLLDVLIFGAVYGSWILSLPLFTLAITLCNVLYVTVSMKTHLVCTSLHIEKNKIGEIMRFTQVLIESLLRKGSVKSIKPIYHVICLLMRSLKIFVSFL